MAFSQRLEIRQCQALVMTPQLMQAIKLLQLSNLDLAAYVDKEVESNPLLERAEGAEIESSGPEPRSRPGADAAEWPDHPVVDPLVASAGPVGNGVDDAAASDAAFSRHSNDSGARMLDWSSVGAGSRQDSDFNVEAFVSAETTLSDYLVEQLAVTIADPVRRMIGRYLIDL